MAGAGSRGAEGTKQFGHEGLNLVEARLFDFCGYGRRKFGVPRFMFDSGNHSVAPHTEGSALVGFRNDLGQGYAALDHAAHSLNFLRGI